MTVAELIERLKAIPDQQTCVASWWSPNDYEAEELVEIQKVDYIEQEQSVWRSFSSDSQTFCKVVILR